MKKKIVSCSYLCLVHSYLWMLLFLDIFFLRPERFLRYILIIFFSMGVYKCWLGWGSDPNKYRSDLFGFWATGKNLRISLAVRDKKNILFKRTPYLENCIMCDFHSRQDHVTYLILRYRNVQPSTTQLRRPGVTAGVMCTVPGWPCDDVVGCERRLHINTPPPKTSPSFVGRYNTDKLHYADKTNLANLKISTMSLLLNRTQNVLFYFI